MNEIFLYISEWGGKEALVGWIVIAAFLGLLAILQGFCVLIRKVWRRHKPRT
jgi:hypothetical protein